MKVCVVRGASKKMKQPQTPLCVSCLTSLDSVLCRQFSCV